MLEKFEKALSLEEIEDELVKIVLELKSSGWEQKDVYEIFSEMLDIIMKNGVKRHENALRDVMDRIVGWCNKNFRLFDTYLET